MNNRSSFWLSLVSLSISIVTILLFFIKVESDSVIDLGTFVGVCTAFIGICVTILIGYQIYNSMSIESKLSRLDKFESKLEESNTKINEIGYNALYRAYVALAKSINQNVVENYQAFFYAIQSLYFALEADRKRKEISFLIYDIERYALNLNIGNGFFSGTREVIEHNVDTYMEQTNVFIEMIRNHSRYDIIEDRFQRLIEAYENRMAIIKQNKAASLVSIYDFNNK